jgi:hypothetical protein
MDVEISVPPTPVVLTPGDETRTRIEVYNLSSAPLEVRLSVARSRAAAWSQAEPPVLDLAAGDRAESEIVFRPPDDAPPTSALQPFTVQAEDVRYGVVAGRGTGLLTIEVAKRLTASLTHETNTRLRLSVTNHGHTPLTLTLEARVDPPHAHVHVEPSVLDVPRGATASAQVEVRPRGPLVGSQTRYAVSVSGRDAAAETRTPLVTVDDAVTVGPQVSRRAVKALLTVLVILALAGAVWWRLAPRLQGQAGPAPAATSAKTDVRRPYALIAVFPRQEGPNGRGAAEATLARLKQAGMPVRLVDSTTTDSVADVGGGLWVLLQDGFASVDEAQRFCDKYRALAPKCNAVP